MAEKSCTIRTRKFMTNKLLMRRQFVSLCAARAHHLRTREPVPPQEPARAACNAAVGGDECSSMSATQCVPLRLS